MRTSSVIFSLMFRSPPLHAGTVEGPKYSTCKCAEPALTPEDLQPSTSSKLLGNFMSVFRSVSSSSSAPKDTPPKDDPNSGDLYSVFPVPIEDKQVLPIEELSNGDGSSSSSNNGPGSRDSPLLDFGG
jgi:hypothetical protein